MLLLQAYCKHRYLPYLESHAYSSKYKQLLACGSVMIAPRIDYPDFFLRALQKGIHYVEVNSDDLCNDMVGACYTLVHETFRAHHLQGQVCTDGLR